ncbi:MAG: hypothetical protein V4530_09465 [Pseudomonadota bacterium]
MATFSAMAYHASMKRSFAKRLALALASSGWIVPLSLSFEWSQDFLWKTYGIANGFSSPDPWHPIAMAAPAFYVALGWLFIVIVTWVMSLTDER